MFREVRRPEIPGIRKPASDHRRSHLVLQQRPVSVILCIHVYVDAPGTLAGMPEALEAPRGALAAMDRGGVATEGRVQWLREEGRRALAAGRQGPRRFRGSGECRTCRKEPVSRGSETRRFLPPCTPAP